MSKQIIYATIGANRQMESISAFVQYVVSNKPVDDIWHIRMSDDNIALASTVFSSTVVEALFL